MDLSQLYVPKIVSKLLNLDTIYFIVAIVLFMLIFLERNIIDIIYLGIITYYYIRIKIHRRRLGK